MFSQEDLDKVLNRNILTRPVAQKLLNIYVCETDWWPHVGRLHHQLSRKFGKDEASEMVKESVAFTILLPAEDRTVKIDYDNPENNLFKWRSFHQFEAKNWFEELKGVIRQDAEIVKYRKQALSLGVIDPIEYQPYCRQAFRWMCDHAEEDEANLTQERLKQFRGLVMAYGGAVISNIFEKHMAEVKKVTNWRTPYFMERLIFDIYDIDKVMKIKSTELERTNKKLVKQIKNIREGNS